MKKKKKKLILGIIALTFCACVTDASKIYVTLNVDGNYVTNVPEPVADSHAVNKRYAHQLYARNVPMAFLAKCGGGQISGYTPVPGEDLHSGMQHGVDWQPVTRFTVDSTGSNVYDNLTGLIWTKNANIDGFKQWASAISYCENLVYGGRSDWRLPNARELFSLIDLSKASPALPAGHPFTGGPSFIYWSSSTDPYHDDMGIHVTMSYGDVDSEDKPYVYLVWPVCGP